MLLFGEPRSPIQSELTDARILNEERKQPKRVIDNEVTPTSICAPEDNVSWKGTPRGLISISISSSIELATTNEDSWTPLTNNSTEHDHKVI